MVVSHAASPALAGHDDVLRVFVTASPATRATRMAGTLGLDEAQSARAVRQSDANRADCIKRFYGISSEHPTHYDLVINTHRLSLESAAELIVAAAGTGLRDLDGVDETRVEPKQ